MKFNYNEPISDALKEDFIKHTNDDDVAAVVSMPNIKIGFHTLKKLRIGDPKIGKVTNENKADALKELYKRAIINAGNKKESAVRDERKMKKNLTKIFDCI